MNKIELYGIVMHTSSYDIVQYAYTHNSSSMMNFNWVERQAEQFTCTTRSYARPPTISNIALTKTPESSFIY